MDPQDISKQSTDFIPYRAYLLDETGHIFRDFDLVAQKDEEALAQARQLAQQNKIEVWRGTKCLGQIGPQGPQEL